MAKAELLFFWALAGFGPVSSGGGGVAEAEAGDRAEAGIFFALPNPGFIMTINITGSIQKW